MWNNQCYSTSIVKGFAYDLYALDVDIRIGCAYNRKYKENIR